MRRTSRIPSRGCFGLATLLLLGSCGHGERPPTARASLAGAAAGWNVLLVSIDTLRGDRLGSFGYTARANSPNIDALAAQGVRFRSAMAQRAATWPSLASTLSGLYPGGHGVLGNGYVFPPDVQTLPKLLKVAGYRTGAFVSNMCSAGHSGWDAFRCTSSNDARANRAALDWAAQLQGSQPFFLWVHYFGPHPPYFNGGERAATNLDPGYSGPVVPRKAALDRLMLGGKPLSAKDLTHLNALYDAAVMGTDDRFGELISGLRESGRLEDTIVVVLADHGEELYEHNKYFYHSCSVYQSALHVPVALIAPGLLAASAVGGEVQQPIELIDIAPTLLALLDVHPPVAMHGSSLVPYLERPNSSGTGKPAYSEYDTSQLRTVLAEGWKLIDNPESLVPDCVPGAPAGFYPIARVELYDLRHDPQELHNLAATEPAKVAELRALIARRFAGIAERKLKQTIPQGLTEELKSLGYVAN